MGKKQKFQISLSLLIFLIVTLVTWQIKGVRKNSAVETQLSSRVSVLQEEYQSEVEKNEDLLDQIALLQDDLTRYRNQITEEGGATKLLREDLDRAEKIAGLTDVKGAGIIITLKDGAGNSIPEEIIVDSGYGIVHDSYILMLMNELRAAGAEAISINDERVLATTEVRCAGPTISINNIKKAAPFEIKVIGDAVTLENALKLPGGAIEQAKLYGIECIIEQNSEITVNKHTGVVSFKYAENIEPEVNE